MADEIYLNEEEEAAMQRAWQRIEARKEEQTKEQQRESRPKQDKLVYKKKPAGLLPDTTQ